ncbi:hypothetical protein [Nonomuraea sp. NPDC005650]|uniref:hypothetical protein n=1 Tax=Nonomuraea sp. NPDC005650 TaxID=3157045 RepID=UPI0033BD7C71
MSAAGEWAWAAGGHRPHGLTALVALLAGCLAGLLAAGSLMRELDAYEVAHRPVIARIVEERPIVSRVVWDGGRHGGWVRGPLERVSDTTARVWLDDRGRPAPRPIGAVEVVFGALVAAVPAGALGWLVVGALLPWWTARRAALRLDREWREYGSSGP